jgi:hypothetical protein
MVPPQACRVAIAPAKHGPFPRDLDPGVPEPDGAGRRVAPAASGWHRAIATPFAAYHRLPDLELLRVSSGVRVHQGALGKGY